MSVCLCVSFFCFLFEANLGYLSKNFLLKPGWRQEVEQCRELAVSLVYVASPMTNKMEINVKPHFFYFFLVHPHKNKFDLKYFENEWYRTTKCVILSLLSQFSTPFQSILLFFLKLKFMIAKCEASPNHNQSLIVIHS